MTNNPKLDNYVLMPLTTYWVASVENHRVILQKPRLGPSLPEGGHHITIGWKEIRAALKTYKHLPYSFVYLFSFLLTDVLFSCLPLEPHLASSRTGAEYHWNSRYHLPEQQVQFLAPARYPLGLVTGDYLDYECR
ncbi:uncharacterized protein F5147DRAFT_770395 [Suillus discolor]|uniref:Uncharacterized protein n=1 Tax=Suillus discolor TaxID=1912936 RepID=A0A9P7FE94_9AGAM|nr:uncharacterized protein F5147DRAFT_770395 [Suillus discolor]KAG2113753.1 hypothetical protein F5147DRAFT_770395 [Suillus discolor]